MENFFIIGTERSGTNLLRLILNSNSSIAIPHPPHIFKYFARYIPYYGDLTKQKNFSQLIKDVFKLVELHPYPWPITFDPQKAEKEIAEKTLMGIYSYLYNHYLQYFGKQIWGCKSTFMIYHVQEILDAYPKAKFIYMIRDGRDVAVSAKKSIFNYFSIYHIAKLWHEEQSIGISWLEKLPQDKIISIRYEDLLTNSQQTITNICQFLNVKYEDNMLLFYQSQEAQKSASLSRSWINTKRPILKDNYQKYKNLLSDKEIQIFEEINGDQLRYFNYPALNVHSNLKHITYISKIFFSLQNYFIKIKVHFFALFTDKNSYLRYKRDLFILKTRIKLMLLKRIFPL